MEKKNKFISFVSKTLNAAKEGGQTIAVNAIYKKMFDHRFTSTKYLSFDIKDFPNLSRRKHTFLSYDNITLTGYVYRGKKDNIKGVFVFVHGYGGGGHHCYLDLINAIVEEGYDVFAYDATANDESEGDGIKGFTRGLLDADKAITYVKSMNKYEKLPLYLCGHSWGAYSVANALQFHPEVKGLISFSGFNGSTSIFEANGELYTGPLSDEIVRIFQEKERSIFGAMADSTAIDSISFSKAKVFFVHSVDDKVVPIQAGYNLYREAFEGERRFKFVHYTSRGHGSIYYHKEGRDYYNSVLKALEEWQKKNKDDQKAKEKFLKGFINRTAYCSMVDKNLVKEATNFIK